MKTRDRHFVDGVYCMIDGDKLRVSNLGIGGFFVATAQPPPLGHVVVGDLHLPGGQSYRIVGEVSWVNDPRGPQSNELPTGFGVKLPRVGAIVKQAILELLKRSDPVMQRAKPPREE